ncbi:MAG: phosphate acyltransferase PlsX [Candidatus Eisenbacteria bacterium]
MRIGLDAMGGDRAPGVIVEGALAALEEAGSGLDITLVGRNSQILKEISSRGIAASVFEIADARDVVAMDEQPSVALRKKRDSSIAVGLHLHREGGIDGFISAGNTGAVVASALFTLGRIEGVKRPAIATYVPTGGGGCVLLDVGANIDCTPLHLFQYGVMGSCYADAVLKKEQPRVGLLNVGEESSKGTGIIQETYKLLKESNLNFIGNVEGRDIFRGSVDVVICDGFVGNIVLKFAESVVDMVYGVMRDSLTSTLRGRIGGLLLKPAFKELKARFDYAEYGSAPLLGVDGVCTIAHGSSSVRAVKNAVLATQDYIRYDVRSIIKERLKKREHSSSKAT